MSIFIQCVVGQFELLKRNDLLVKLFASERRVRMDVQSSGQWGISLAGDKPR
jgi:hypothetical protein